MNRTRSKHSAVDGQSRNVDRKRRMARPRFPGLGHKLWQLQLATTGARPARPEWAQRSASIRIMLGGLSLLPDLERYYKSSVPDSIAAAIWFTGTTKKSHAYTERLRVIGSSNPAAFMSR
ncbi:unnamed protein product [Withania somnifera]